MRSTTWSTAALVLSLAVLLVPASRAADHLDSSGLTPPGGDVRLDITDIYAFRSPECSDCTVFVAGLNPLTDPGVSAAFAKKGSYKFRVDTDGDAVQDMTFDVKFGRQNDRGIQRFKIKLREANGPSATIVRRRDGRTTPVEEEPFAIQGKRGIRVFAGMADDPFFFDLPGFLDLDFCATDPAPDTFAGTNVSVLVLEVPNAVLTGNGNNIGLWVETWRGGHQIDRMGRPAINTVFIPTNPLEPDEASMKDAYNANDPAWDRMKFRGEVLDTLEIFYGAGSPDAAGLADFLLPDILTLDVTATPPASRTVASRRTTSSTWSSAW
ncbi:MAG: DUF4331 family protein [Thermoanaerobaculia bacterium]